jgi:glycosyltransferase involved in cell wall biosynthesis
MTNSGRRLSIVYVGTLPPHAGGCAIVGSLLLPGLEALGHSVRAVASITATDQKAGDDFARRHPGIDVTRYVLPYLESSSDTVVPMEYRELERERLHEVLPGLLGRERPDVIIAGRESFAWHVPQLALEHGIPTTLVVHGGRTVRKALDASSDADGGRLLDGFRMVDTVVAVARHLAERLRRKGLRDVQVVPNPVDTERFSPGPKDPTLLRELSISPAQTVVLFASRLASVKRPLDLVESARQAIAKNPGLVYLIVGDGPCREAVVEACRRHGISGSFRFVGWVPHDHVPQYMRLADVVVLPSELEGQSLVYLEAQACGRLLLASDIPAAREVVTDGHTGLLFPKGDIEELTAKTLLVAGSTGWREEIGRRARGRVGEHSVDVMTRRYAAILEAVASRGRAVKPAL